MAKHRFQRTRSIPATRLLLCGALVLGWAVSASWAGQHVSMNPSAATGQTTGPKTAKSAHSPAQHKATASPGSISPAGKRDPFKLPESASGKGGGPAGASESVASMSGNLPPGTRGLLISQLRLQGVVREQVSNKMIAVVTNETKRAYFLTENEAVYNGVVSKITPDSVTFTENVLDANGRVTTREVVRKLGSAPGEGR